MTQEELIRGYEKLVADQAAIIRGYAEIINSYEKMQNNPAPSPVQYLLNQEIMMEHLKENSSEPLEFDSLKLSDEDRRKRFGTRIRLLRKSLNLTQDQLAQKIGASKSLVCSYETGRKEAGYKNLIGIARALNTTTDWLLGEPPPIQ